jgi:hypothetical protein
VVQTRHRVEVKSHLRRRRGEKFMSWRSKHRVSIRDVRLRRRRRRRVGKAMRRVNVNRSLDRLHRPLSIRALVVIVRMVLWKASRCINRQKTWARGRNGWIVLPTRNGHMTRILDPAARSHHRAVRLAVVDVLRVSRDVAIGSLLSERHGVVAVISFRGASRGDGMRGLVNSGHCCSAQRETLAAAVHVAEASGRLTNPECRRMMKYSMGAGESCPDVQPPHEETDGNDSSSEKLRIPLTCRRW